MVPMVLKDSRPATNKPWEGESMIDCLAASKDTPLKRKANEIDHLQPLSTQLTSEAVWLFET